MPPVRRARIAHGDGRGIEHVAKEWLASFGAAYPVGSVARGRFLLQLIVACGPYPVLRDAYFDNLESLLAPRPRRMHPGRLVIGVGSGRCGSTSLTALVSSIAGACATHENPPLLDWQPRPAQLDLHIRRFALLAQYFPVVFDAAHWWLNAAPALVAAFPDLRFVGLIRDPDATTRSFLAIKGIGPGSFNHWVAADDGPWRASVWDHTYPDYPHPPLIGPADGSVKAALIGRYVREYHASLAALQRRWPDRALLLRTEDLSSARAQRRLYTFIGAGRGILRDLRLNTSTIDDGARNYWY
jgi:hypothetical protein